MTAMLKIACIAMLAWVCVTTDTCNSCMEIRFDDGSILLADNPCVSSRETETECPQGSVCSTYALTGKLRGYVLYYKIAECSLPETDCEVLTDVMHSYTSIQISQCEKGVDVWDG